MVAAALCTDSLIACVAPCVRRAADAAPSHDEPDSGVESGILVDFFARAAPSGSLERDPSRRHDLGCGRARPQPLR